MTVAETPRKAGPYAGNGVTTVFPFAFKVFTKDDVQVVYTDANGAATTLVLNSDYSMVLNADQDSNPGGTITYPKVTGPLPLPQPLAAGATLTAIGDLPYAQPTDVTNTGRFLPQVVENALDRATIQIQQLAEVSNRTFQVPVGAASNQLLFPFPESLKYLRWRSDLQGLENADIGPLSAPGGADLIGFLQAGVGAVPRSVQDKAREWVSPEDFGAVGNDVADDSLALQKAITAAAGRPLLLERTYLVSAGLSFNGWSGTVFGPGRIRFATGVAISKCLDFSNAVDVLWLGPTIDMGQTSGTLTGGLRTDSGFYMKDARACKFTGGVINCKFGEPIYVDGTSSVSPSASHGSKRIFFDNFNVMGISSGTVDDGAFINVRSDFFTGDGGGAYIAASNACKVSDYTLDAAVAYQRTTEHIYFSNCHFENCDRFAVLNAKGVHLSNVSMINFYTRGLTMSPSCEHVTWDGGTVSGNAAQVNANFVCHDITISNLTALGETVSAGQRHALRTGYGSYRIRFSNIVGSGNDVRHVFIEGARDVKFSNVSLDNWSGGTTTVAVSIAGGHSGNTSSWVTDDIVFEGCTFSANSALKFDDNAGTATVAMRGVRFSNCNFLKTLQFFSGAQPTGGQIMWSNSTATKVGSAQDLDTRAFAIYEGGNLNLRCSDTFAAVGSTTYATFADAYYSTTERDGSGGDATRMPNVRAFIKKSGDPYFQPLLYNVDWFIDGTIAVAGMTNQIRMVTPASVAAGDTIAIERLR